MVRVRRLRRMHLGRRRSFARTVIVNVPAWTSSVSLFTGRPSVDGGRGKRHASIRRRAGVRIMGMIGLLSGRRREMLMVISGRRGMIIGPLSGWREMIVVHLRRAAGLSAPFEACVLFWLVIRGLMCCGVSSKLRLGEAARRRMLVGLGNDETENYRFTHDLRR